MMERKFKNVEIRQRWRGKTTIAEVTPQQRRLNDDREEAKNYNREEAKNGKREVTE